MGKIVLPRAALILICGLAGSAFAATDLGLEAGGRTYPLSGTVDVTLGSSLGLWGQRGQGNQPWYGYTRASVRVSTAGAYNAAHGEFEIFPVSIFGISAGGEAANNTSAYRAYDCEVFNCLGPVWRTFIKGSLALGAGPVFLVGRYQLENLKQHPDQSLDFVEPQSGLAGQAEGDQLKTGSGLAGVKFGGTWSIAYAYIWSEMQRRKGVSETHLGLLMWTRGKWRVVAGGGTFWSDLKAREGTAVFRLEWQPWPRPGLF